MACNAIKLDKKDFFGKSDPFLKFYRMNDDGRFVNIKNWDRYSFVVRQWFTRRNSWRKHWIPHGGHLNWKLIHSVRVAKIKFFWWNAGMIIYSRQLNNIILYFRPRFEPDFIGSCQVNLEKLLDEGKLEIPVKCACFKSIIKYSAN